MTRPRLVALALLSASCGSTTNVTVTQVAPGAQCANGGVSIKVGGGDPQIVCNGTNGANGSNGTNGSNGFNTLVSETQLPVADPHCPGGGVRIDSGLDNGAGGGKAGDGVLQPGEILSTQYVCNGDTGARPGSLTPPTGPAGAFTLKAVGGASTTGVPGAGGSISLSFGNGTNGGNLDVFRTGLDDASFTFPAIPTPDLGAAPATVSADATISNQTTTSPALAAGVLFTAGSSLYISTGSGLPPARSPPA